MERVSDGQLVADYAGGASVAWFMVRRYASEEGDV